MCKLNWNKLQEIYNTKETWVLLGNITSRIMIPLNNMESYSIPDLELVIRWAIQSATLLWIGIILTNLAHDYLKQHPHMVKPFAFLCGFAPIGIIELLLGIISKTNIK